MKTFILFVVLMLTGLVTAPDAALSGAQRGLELCSRVVVPSLFPFFVCAGLLTKTGAVRMAGRLFEPVMRPLFRVPGAAGIAFVMGILSGYPVGARIGCELYEKKLCTKDEAQRIAGFCNNAGPLFIIGAVGAGMLGSRELGFALYLVHILSALTTGLCLGLLQKEPAMRVTRGDYPIPRSQASVGEAFSQAVTEGAELTLYVSGFIVFFATLTAILEHFGVVGALAGILTLAGVRAEAASALIYGFLEVTSGAARLASPQLGAARLVLLSGIIAFSGVSVLLQVSGILVKSGLSIWPFLRAKLLQTGISMVYALVLLRLPFIDTSVFMMRGYRYTHIPPWGYSARLMAFGMGVFLVMALLSLIRSSMGRRR